MRIHQVLELYFFFVFKGQRVLPVIFLPQGLCLFTSSWTTLLIPLKNTVKSVTVTATGGAALCSPAKA